MRNIFVQAYALFVIALLLFGCAAPGMKLDSETAKGFDRIGIISLLGEEIEANYVGITMFGNEYVLTPALGWALNQKAINVASNSLENSGIEVVKIDYNYSGMWQKYKKSQDNYFTRLSEYYGNDTTTPIIKDELQNLATVFSVDGFILIVPGHEGPYCQGGEPCIGYGDYGYGIHNRLNRSFDAYISARLYFIPVDTLKAISQSSANMHVSLPFTEWKEAYSDYSVKENQYIKTNLYLAALLAIPQAIDSMGLSRN